MTSSSLLTPHFPPLRPDTLYSFYPYPTIARHRTNHSLLNPRSPYAARPGTDPAADLVPLSNEPGQSDAEALLYHLNDTSARNTTASPLPTPVGPGPWPAQATVEAKAQQKMVLERAQRRALHLQSPCGVGMDINEDRLAYAELNLVDDQQELAQFGDRFLLPYGRRQTQLEADRMAMNVRARSDEATKLTQQQPSPTPSHGHSRFGQEDRTGGGTAQSFAPPAALPEGDDSMDADMQAEPSTELNLDDDVEDMDASGFTDD